MKKIIFVLSLLIVSMTLTCSAKNYSYSSDGVDLDADIMRQGDNIYMNYTIEGLNSASALQKASPEHRQAMSQVSSAKVNMVMSCSQKAMKINSLDLTGSGQGALPDIANTGWIPISNPDDLRKLEEMCNKL